MHRSMSFMVPSIARGQHSYYLHFMAHTITAWIIVFAIYLVGSVFM